MSGTYVCAAAYDFAAACLSSSVAPGNESSMTSPGTGFCATDPPLPPAFAVACAVSAVVSAVATPSSSFCRFAAVMGVRWSTHVVLVYGTMNPFLDDSGVDDVTRNRHRVPGHRSELGH